MTINRRKLLKDAWAYAKAFAQFDGSSPRALFADALRRCWAEAKAIAARATRQGRPADRATSVTYRGSFGGGMVRSTVSPIPYNGW